jgi:nicotinamidase/pyrazinamidase
MTHALLLIDLQHDFLPGGALAVADADAVVPLARALQGHFDVVVASQDWHPADHGSFAANHPDGTVYDVIELHGLPQVLWPIHCVQGSRGADLVDGLEPDHIVQKGTDPRVDSYSAFFDNGHRQDTGLNDWLKARGVDRVYVMGLATDYCVKFSALDAVACGFETYLIEDGCRGVEASPGDVEAAMNALREAGVRIVRSKDLRVTG